MAAAAIPSVSPQISSSSSPGSKSTTAKTSCLKPSPRRHARVSAVSANGTRLQSQHGQPQAGLPLRADGLGPAKRQDPVRSHRKDEVREKGAAISEVAGQTGAACPVSRSREGFTTSAKETPETLGDPPSRCSIVNFMLDTGLRLGEVIKLELGDVEISERKGKVLVRHGKGATKSAWCR